MNYITHFQCLFTLIKKQKDLSVVLLPCKRRKGILPYTPADGGNSEENTFGSFWDEQGFTP